jgi:hypothetical protein
MPNKIITIQDFKDWDNNNNDYLIIDSENFAYNNQ